MGIASYVVRSWEADESQPDALQMGFLTCLFKAMPPNAANHP
ncbi:MAG TPA: hypothetical protein VGO57_13030 [Verrucomicrobiae bacterium]